ncbi:hypothetical protein BH23ACI1_BH23ACI1_30600 [soil metagenome]
MAILNRLLIVAALLVCVAMSSLAAQRPAAQLTEPEAKANFLYYLALFASWPPAAGNDALTVCLFGATPISQALRVYEGRVVAGRRLDMRDLRAGDDLRGCHVLFLPRADPRRLASALSAVAGAPVLTVGEDDTFLAAGGMLRLTIDHERLRFDVELQPADRVGITFSSRLLGQAARVTRGGRAVKP